MNSFAVSLMNAKGGASRHASEKALLGYCSFHHMLLALSAKHFSIAQVAKEKLRNFMRGEHGCHKSQTPDLGQLIVYCAVAEPGFGWEDIASAVVREAGVRGVMWLLRENPRLESSNVSDAVLVRDCFQGRLTGLRLLMFQALFLRSVACVDAIAPCEALRRYNLQFGLPTSSQKENLFAAARDILAVGTWPAFYSSLGLPCPSIRQQAVTLRQAIDQSAICGYHRSPVKKQRSIPRKGTQKSHPQSGRQQPINVAEKVGVKQDLQRAFSKAAYRQDGRSSKSTKMLTSIAVGSSTAVHQKHSAITKLLPKFQNQFAAIQSDSESD